MSASGRYLEYIQVNSKNVIVEVRVLESKVTVCGKQIATNKWLLPTQWQEVYSILHTGAEYCMNSKDRTTLVASGKDVEVALMFKPYLAVYQYVMQPYSISGIVEAVEDSGNGWIESKPYKVMIIASVAPKRNSDIWSTVESGRNSENYRNPWCGPIEKISHSGIMWRTLDNVEVQMSSHKLEDEYFRSPEHASVIQDNFNHPFDMCYSQDISEVKYSKYTGEASWATVDSGSTVVSFKDVDHKHNFKSKSSPSDVSSNASSSGESYKLRPKKIRKLSKKHNITKNKTSDSPKSKKNGQTKYTPSSSGTFIIKEHKQRNTQEKINRFLSPLEKKTNTKSKNETDLESSSSSGRSITKRKASGVENTFETVSVKWNLRKNNGTRTDKITSSFSLNSKGKVNKSTTSETISLKCDNSSKDFKLETKKRKLQHKVSSKNECGNGSTITQFFQKKSFTFSPSCTAQTSVKIREESISELSNNDDECVPDTPPQEPNFHIIRTTEKKECLMKNSRSADNSLIMQKSSSLSQIVNLNCDKYCNKTVTSSEERRQTKQKRNQLSSRRKGSRPVKDVNKDELSTNIRQSFVSAQTKESAIFKNLRSSKGSISVTTSASERLQSENHKFESSAVSNTSLLQLKRNERSKEKKEKPSMLPNTSFCSRNSESPLESKTVESSQMEERSASSNSAVQDDITATHLTLAQLEKKFDENVEYLRAIMNGKQYCWRQIQFKNRRFDSMDLKYSLSTVPYTNEQIHHLLYLLRKNFCKENNFVKLYDYLMKVLLPEATTKILMDEFSLTHSEVLDKIHNTYIVARKRMPFLSDNEDDYDNT